MALANPSRRRGKAAAQVPNPSPHPQPLPLTPTSTPSPTLPQVLGESCGHLTAAKLLLLTFLCCYYNKNLWYKGLLRSSTGVCLRAPASVLRCSRSMLSLCPQPASRKAADAYPVAECPPLGPGAAPGAAPALKPERAKQE